jgi:hypothetical protein
MDGNVENNQAESNLKGKVIQVPLVDETLSKAGYAADAKVVGEALGSLTGMYEQMVLDVANIEEPPAFDINSVKPRGTYSGNGSAASRTIPVKGEGQVVLIYGGVGAVFVTPYGAYAINSSGVASFLPVAQIYKGNDGIVMTTDNALVNKNGNTYGYQLL